jgi:hypothetical protein
LSGSRRLGGFSLVHLLLLGAVAEVAINRLAVGALPPPPRLAETPAQHTILSYAGLFLLYFASTLSIGVVAVRAARLVRGAGATVETRIRGGLLAAFAAVAAVAVAAPPSSTTSFVLQTLCVAAAIAVVVSAIGRRGDLGLQVGLVLVLAPLVIHYGGSFAGRVLMSEEQVLDSDLVDRVKRWGQWAVCAAAVLSPYCLAPRPVARALVRPIPLALALGTGALAAVLLRHQYAVSIMIAKTGIGIDLGPGVSENQMGLYLLALATMVWTIASCALADSAPRRQVALGLVLIALGGHGYTWPLQYLLAVVGLVVMAEAAPALREAEAGVMVARTPVIDDGVWQSFVTALAAGLRRGDEAVSALTVRGDHDLTTSILVTERAGLPVKLRIERLDGAVVCLDVICGREVDERQAATFTVAARPDRLMAAGTHPEPPPSGAATKTGDDAFDQRFRLRGDGDQLVRVIDDGARARFAATIDGWVAWWDGRSLRYRVYPGAGAPLDHPVPISDLALRRSGQAERLVAVVELLAEVAAVGLAASAQEPSALRDQPHEAAPGGSAPGDA